MSAIHHAMSSRHANARAQQRGIPPLVELWLDEYGEEEYDGHGGIVRYFSRNSIRRMERNFGCKPVRRMAEYLNAYKVESAHDGYTITLGHRVKRIKRR